MTPSQGNDAVEVGIVPVSEVEENFDHTILGVVNWGGKGPSFLKKDIYSIIQIWLVKSTYTKDESTTCRTYYVNICIRIYIYIFKRMVLVLLCFEPLCKIAMLVFVIFFAVFSCNSADA